MAYLLDANVFIEAKNRYYGLDFCPAFWEWLVEKNAGEQVLSIEKVGDELAAGTDELAKWAAKRGEKLFRPVDEAVLPSLAALGNWVQGQKFRSSAISAFLEDTDYYLVAYAHAHKHVVVTLEVPSDGVKGVKIPNACIGIRVKFVTPFEMLRQERAHFVLDSKA
jgi:hypothetical protein